MAAGARRRLAVLAALALVASAAAALAAPDPVPGFAMRGSPKYAPGFSQFDYVRGDAPKGGNIVLALPGTFDSLNPYILKGTPTGVVANTIDTLMVRSQDEPYSVYAHIAESITVPEDRSWAVFAIDPRARFHDGSPITAADVAWTFEALIREGHPTYRLQYEDVEAVEVMNERKVRFRFKPGETRQLPLLVAGLPVLSKSYYAKQPFNQTSLEPPLGNGPYKVTKVDGGKSITLERVADYWAKDLPVARGRFNFARMRTDYYRDLTIWTEAFKAGQFDLKTENVSKEWATGYNIPAVAQGQIVKERFDNHSPQPMQGFAYNLRRPLFQDRLVREALAYAFDFEWSNRTLFYEAYRRTRSYFPNSEMEAKGLPSGEELALLEPFRAELPIELFEKEYQPPKTDGSGNIRGNLGIALKLLGQAGWSVKENRLVDKSGKAFEFEILLGDATFERVALPFTENLKRLGIAARVRTIDPAQYQHRMENFDFDVTTHLFFETLSPGNEMRDYWGTRSAEMVGSNNVIGIKSPAVDALIDRVINAPDQASLLTSARALDRVLQWGFYVIPEWHRPTNQAVYWNIFDHPKTPPYLASTVDIGFDAWWYDPAKAAKITLRSRAD